MRHSGLSMQPGAAPVAWPPTARRTRPNWLLVLLGVAALHLLLLQLLQPALRGESPAPTAGAPARPARSRCAIEVRK
ncbi:MAG TPA: hypothetical protein PLO41_17180, partial [Rubrivivax sp.]|nr:hypothetical protein [Rubrivivax sp.]